MITLEDIQAKIAKIEALQYELRDSVEAFKKQPEPCPLEEGKQVNINLRNTGVQLFDSTIAVTKPEEDGNWVITIESSGWGRIDALAKAREIIKQFGGKSD